MNSYKKTVIGRTLLLLLLVAAAVIFAIAVHGDRSDGGVLDEEGVLDESALPAEDSALPGDDSE